MAPFRDTMRFIDCNPSKLLLLVDGTEMFSEMVQLAELRSHVEKTCTRVAASKIVEDGNLQSLGRGTVDCCNIDAC
jgi:hypothetical protein